MQDNSQNIVTVKTFANRVEAEIAQSLLQSAGIKSIVQSDDAGGMYQFPQRSGFGSTKLLVKQSDSSDAQLILDSSTENN